MKTSKNTFYIDKCIKDYKKYISNIKPLLDIETCI